MTKAEWIRQQIAKMEKEIENLNDYIEFLLEKLEDEEYDEFVNYVLEKEMRLKK